MREILFRGKRIDNGEWEYGGCVSTENEVFLIYNQTHSIDLEPHTVEKRTIGQYTGLTDRNGKKIFEGDIVSTVDGNYLVFCDDYAGFHFEIRRELTGGYIKLESLSFYECEVIGNIHDNQDLIGESV